MTTVEVFSVEETSVSLSTARDLADAISDHMGLDVLASKYNGTVSISIAESDWDGIAEQRVQDFIEAWLFAHES